MGEKWGFEYAREIMCWRVRVWEAYHRGKEGVQPLKGTGEGAGHEEVVGQHL